MDTVKNIMKSNTILKLVCFAFVLVSGMSYAANTSYFIDAKNGNDHSEEVNFPNIVLILADDLGYGDISHLNPESKITTKNIDRLAESGISFLDAHSPSSMCTPTRYGLLTGRYAWRTRLKESVLYEWEPPLISSDRLTIATILSEEGYHTACFGKWHLGAEWNMVERIPVDSLLLNNPKTRGLEYRRVFDYGRNIDWEDPIIAGPTDVGFDYYFGLINSHNSPPYTYVENKTVRKIPSGMMNISQKEKAGDITKRGITPGVMDPDHEINSVMNTHDSMMVDYIHKQSKTDQPFFLYYASPAVHLPITPDSSYIGKSQIGLYGDFVINLDATVGVIMDALKTNGVLDNTLIIFTSDNGPVPHFHSLKSEFDHYSAYYLKGCKMDNWEGGNRVPFIVSWPERIEKGSTSNALLCLTDLMATFADLVGFRLPENAGEDSYSALKVFLGTDNKGIRDELVMHSGRGEFAFRFRNWKILFHPGSGGKNYQLRDNRCYLDKTEILSWKGTPPMNPYNDSDIQLYNLDADPYESHNLAKDHAEIVDSLSEKFMHIVHRGRSTKGPIQLNDPHPQWHQLEWLFELYPGP